MKNITYRLNPYQNEFQLNTAISFKGNEIATLIKDSNSVSLHIRRSDYVQGSYSDQILDALSINYYTKAIEKLSAEEKNLKDIISYVVSSKALDSTINELALEIASNGTKTSKMSQN